MRLLGRARAVAVAIGLVCVLGACSDRLERPEILALAAASLADVMGEVEREFERSDGVEVSFSYGGSQSLARQIAGGAPADVFVSAGGHPMDELRAEGLIVGEPAELFGNALVVATRSPDVSQESLAELVGQGSVRMAMADPELAPAGRYARQALESVGLWEPSGGSLVFAPDVRAALAYVESRNVDAAIVYRTDAEAVQGVRALDIVPADSHERIVYPAAAVSRSSNQAHAARFVAFLRGPEAQAIFRRHGFVEAKPEPEYRARSADDLASDAIDITTIAVTLGVAAAATAVNFPLALGLAWLMVRKRIRGRFVVDLLVSLPLALPPVAVGYFLLLLLGRDGPVGAVVHGLLGVDLVFTWVAAALAAAVVSFPLTARAVMVAMEGVDERLEASARSLGAGPVRVFFTITVPLAYTGILAGVLLGFVRALGEFGATIIVAGNIPGRTQTLPLAIFTEVQSGDSGAAVRLVGVSIALAVVTLAAHNWLLERSGRRP